MFDERVQSYPYVRVERDDEKLSSTWEFVGVWIGEVYVLNGATYDDEEASISVDREVFKNVEGGIPMNIWGKFRRSIDMILDVAN